MQSPALPLYIPLAVVKMHLVHFDYSNKYDYMYHGILWQPNNTLWQPHTLSQYNAAAEYNKHSLCKLGRRKRDCTHLGTNSQSGTSRPLGMTLSQLLDSIEEPLAVAQLLYTQNLRSGRKRKKWEKAIRWNFATHWLRNTTILHQETKNHSSDITGMVYGYLLVCVCVCAGVFHLHLGTVKWGRSQYVSG